MRIRDTRLWALIIAVAFLVLWCVSVGVTYAVPAEEPLPQPARSVIAPQIRAIGIMGWMLVGVGFLGIALAVILGSGRPKRRRRRPSYRMARSVYAPTVRRYQRNIERRF